MNSIDCPTYSRLLAQLESFGQAHLLRFWDELDDVQRDRLASQIEATDFALVQNLFQGDARGPDWHDLASRAEPPPAITLEEFCDPQRYRMAREAGEAALSAGRVAMILTAGGQGSRLGFEHPKGMFPIGPLSNRTLYQIIFEKVLARSRQFGKPIPMYVMTSPPTHAESARFLAQNDWFGFDADQVTLFCQGTMPAVDDRGRVLLAAPGELFQSPDGHGGMLPALVRTGNLDAIRQRGIDTIFYGQIDNPLIQACDPALIGFHLLQRSEMTTQVVRKQSPLQKVGNVVQVDGRVQIIEYSDLPETAALQTAPDGSLKFWAGSIAVHVFDRDFLDRASRTADALPFHRARKKVPYVGDRGETVVPDQPNATKFERFIFDLLPTAKHAIVCEVDPADGFCAVKNAPPADSETPEHVRQAILDQHRRWLRSAGVDVADDVPVEISPLFAVDAEQVAHRASEIGPIREPTFLMNPTNP